MSENGDRRYVVEVDPARRERLSGRPEFPEELPLGDKAGDQGVFSRRSFLSALGLSAAAFASACSRSPVGHILPFNDKPEEMTPGVPLYYASVCGGCSARCGALVKTRDGRPIKMEGNDRHPLSRGGLCAVGQASVLSLYDAARARGPSVNGQATDWAKLDEEVKSGLQKAGAKGIYVVTGVDVGPTEEAALARLVSAYPGAKRVIHDTSCALSIATAHAATHGVRAIPRYRLDRAEVVLGIEADFLGTWLSPVSLTRQWASARDAKKGKMLRHFQVEPRLSLTGSNADVRFTARPSDTVPILAALAKALMRDGLPADVAKVRAPELAQEKVRRLTSTLRAAGGKALVLCGNPDPAAQALTNLVNQALGAYGTTVDLEDGAPVPEALSMDDLFEELSKKGAGAVILRGVNPAYDHPRGGELKALLGKVDLSVSLSDRRDETVSLARLHAPAHDPLEAWGDARSSRSIVSLQQPCVQPIFETRGAIATWLRFAGEATEEDVFLRARWEKEVLPRVQAPAREEGAAASLVKLWEQALQDGFVEMGPEPAPSAPVEPTATGDTPAPTATAMATAVAAVPTTTATATSAEAAATVPTATATAPTAALSKPVFQAEGAALALKGHPALGAAKGTLEIALHEKVSLRDGRLANNAWLQEMPDPISKVTWTNYAVVSEALSRELGVAEGDMLSVTAQGKTVTLPALIEPGVHPKVIAIAVGYGRTAAGPMGNEKGQNAFVFGRRALERDAAQAARAEGHKDLAKSQTEPSQHEREIVRETTLSAFLANPSAGNEEPGHGGAAHEKRHLTMWQDHAYPGAKWQMNIDLSACTGCSACVVACQAENNIPTVGEIEVLRRREMHWIRVDRYFAGDAEEPTVLHQPMMCQHCDNAPCETVCPVLATVHSSEGLNQQVYNRCVGTRYCANNCPPKVRRFNWFDYPHEDPLEQMVLNPDVVVRSRGVMEKCSFCVQRISEGKARAKSEGRPVRDGDMRTACEQSCPAQAITFGNAHDPESRITKLQADERRYRILEELNIEPAVSYLLKVRAEGAESATDAKDKEGHHG